jgi:Ca2+-transporting ATPase
MVHMQDLVISSFVGEVDPPRAEAKEAIAKAKRAGIQVRMITGDHAVTAAAIGQELGIEGRAITGAEFAAMSEDEAMREIDEVGVIARVAPEHKVRLVSILKKKGNIVAMTGDGVNDAPALKAADIGIAMGMTGTDVAKGAARMILTDDNFATIISAVEEGERSMRSAEIFTDSDSKPLYVYPRLSWVLSLCNRRDRSFYPRTGPLDSYAHRCAYRSCTWHGCRISGYHESQTTAV